MTENHWRWRTLLVVLFVTAAFTLPVAAQNTTSTEPLTWTLAPTPAETTANATLEETPIETLVEEIATEIPEETSIETLVEATTTETSEETLVTTRYETTANETLEETPTDTQIEEPLNESLENRTLSAVPGNETLDNETYNGTLESDIANTTTTVTGPPVIIGMDEEPIETAPVENTTVDMPTFTPIQAAQVNPSPTSAAPLSVIGAIGAIAVAALLVVISRRRR